MVHRGEISTDRQFAIKTSPSEYVAVSVNVPWQEFLVHCIYMYIGGGGGGGEHYLLFFTVYGSAHVM